MSFYRVSLPHPCKHCSSTAKCYMPRPSQPPRSASILTVRGEECKQLRSSQRRYFRHSFISSLLRPKYLPQYPILENSRVLCYSLNGRDQVLHPYKLQAKITSTHTKDRNAICGRNTQFLVVRIGGTYL